MRSIKNYSPQLKDPYVRKLEDLIDSEWNPQEVQFIEQPGARESHCYLNVDNYIASKGGRCQLGWLILKTDFAYEAMAHAVVEPAETPDEFIDVSPFEGLQGTKRLFIPDDRVEWKGRPIPSYRICYTGRPIDEDFTRLMRTLDIIQSKKHFPDSSDTMISDHTLLVTMENDFRRTHIPYLISKMPHVHKTGRCWCSTGKLYVECHRKELDQMIATAEATIASLTKSL